MYTYVLTSETETASYFLDLIRSIFLLQYMNLIMKLTAASQTSPLNVP